MVFKPFRAGPGHRCSVADKIVEVEGDLLDAIPSQKGEIILEYGASDPRCLLFRMAAFITSCSLSIAPVFVPQAPPILGGISLLTWAAGVWWRNNERDLIKKHEAEAVPSANVEFAVKRLASSKEYGPGLWGSMGHGIMNGMFAERGCRRFSDAQGGE